MASRTFASAFTHFSSTILFLTKSTIPTAVSAQVNELFARTSSDSAACTSCVSTPDPHALSSRTTGSLTVSLKPMWLTSGSAICLMMPRESWTKSCCNESCVWAASLRKPLMDSAMASKSLFLAVILVNGWLFAIIESCMK